MASGALASGVEMAGARRGHFFLFRFFLLKERKTATTTSNRVIWRSCLSSKTDLSRSFLGLSFFCADGIYLQQARGRARERLRRIMGEQQRWKCFLFLFCFPQDRTPSTTWKVVEGTFFFFSVENQLIFFSLAFPRRSCLVIALPAPRFPSNGVAAISPLAHRSGGGPAASLAHVFCRRRCRCSSPSHRTRLSDLDAFLLGARPSPTPPPQPPSPSPPRPRPATRHRRPTRHEVKRERRMRLPSLSSSLSLPLAPDGPPRPLPRALARRDSRPLLRLEAQEERRHRLW